MKRTAVKIKKVFSEPVRLVRVLVFVIFAFHFSGFEKLRISLSKLICRGISAFKRFTEAGFCKTTT